MGGKKENSHPGSVERRDFIRQSAFMCCMMHMPFMHRDIFREDTASLEGTKVNPVELAAYCGLFCGACDIYQKRIAKSGGELKKLLDALDFAEFSDQMPGLEDYDSFYNILNTIITLFGECPSCQKGGGNPDCPIRLCAKEKGYQTCAECPSCPCDKLTWIVESYPPAKDNLKEIEAIGLEKWAVKQQVMVDKGFRYSDILGKKSKS